MQQARHSPQVLATAFLRIFIVLLRDDAHAVHLGAIQRPDPAETFTRARRQQKRVGLPQHAQHAVQIVRGHQRCELFVERQARRHRRQEHRHPARHQPGDEFRQPGRERFFAVHDHEHPTGPGGAIGLGKLGRRNLDQHHAAQIRTPGRVERGQKPPAAQKAAADRRPGVVDAAAFLHQMRAGDGRFLAKLRRVDLERDTTGLAGAAGFFRAAHGCSK